MESQRATSTPATDRTAHYADMFAALGAEPRLRILRSLLHLIQATLRTSFFQRGAAGRPKSYTAFKLDPQSIPDLPAPRPRFEIFVYSPEMEGIHLRGGMVARGGIRWSDRREDFRTDLVRAVVEGELE